MDQPVLLELLTLSKQETEWYKNSYYELRIENESDWMLITFELNVERLAAFKEHKRNHQYNSKVKHNT